MTLTPYLFYEDVDEAARWLQAAFGFSHVVTSRDEQDQTTYELWWDGSSVMIGHFGRHYQNPKHTGYVSQLVYVEVDDIDDHFARATAAGATIVDPVTDKPYGIRQYTAADPEGHRWVFGRSVRDVLPQEMEDVTVSG
jgi:uncharacterized glyoxalase superfamily protein PhnB